MEVTKFDLFSPQEEKVQSSEVKPRGFSVLPAEKWMDPSGRLPTRSEAVG